MVTWLRGTLAARLRFAAVAAFVLQAAVACGGHSTSDDDDDGGNSGASGETSTGGTTALGGTGGTTTTGGTAGTTAQGGTGGSTANGGTGNASGNGGSAGTAGAPTAEPLPFLHRSGSRIVDPDGAAVALRGIAFGNDVWNEPKTPVFTHHTAEDFTRIHDWGANVVRFYLNYQLFEDDDAPGVYKQSGFDWLDRNIDQASRAGVYLIFNVHVPQGGFQSNGDGDALWTDPANETRFVALWRAIAEHCEGNGTVAGYDLLNEPRPTLDRAEWVDLSARVTAAIREVDADHMLVIERTNSVGDDWSNDADMNFFLSADDNVLYEFHFYEPFEYTTQLAEWLDLGEGGKYPDESRISTANLTWYNWNYEPEPPPYAPPGDSDWTPYVSDYYVLDDPSINVIGIALVSELNSGTVWFDDVFIDDRDPDTGVTTRIYTEDIESMDGWSFWQAGTTGSASVSSEAHSGKGSLMITNTDHDANLASTVKRVIQHGHSYAVGGYMKGQAIAHDSRPDPRGDWTQVSRALIRLDYFTADGGPMARDKASLAASLDKFTAWGAAHDVPLFVGEFGLIHYCFEDGRGGTNWVNDMLDLMDQRSLNYTYHVFHEPAFGIFQSDASIYPNEADMNAELVEALRGL